MARPNGWRRAHGALAPDLVRMLPGACVADSATGSPGRFRPTSADSRPTRLLGQAARPHQHPAQPLCLGCPGTVQRETKDPGGADVVRQLEGLLEVRGDRTVG